MRDVKIIGALSILGAILVIAACETNDSGASANAERQAVTGEPATGPEAPATRVDEAAVQPNEVAEAPSDEVHRALPGMSDDETVEMLTQAGDDAGGTPCERVYAGMVAMSEHVGDEPPVRDQYLQACGALPEEVQRCLMPGYRMAHADACEQAHANLDPALAADMDRAFNNRPSGDQEQ